MGADPQAKARLAPALPACCKPALKTLQEPQPGPDCLSRPHLYSPSWALCPGSSQNLHRFSCFITFAWNVFSHVLESLKFQPIPQDQDCAFSLISQSNELIAFVLCPLLRSYSCF